MFFYDFADSGYLFGIQRGIQDRSRKIFRTEVVIRGRADNTMALSKIIKRRPMGDAILHRILKNKQYEPH
jgi:hypothetical protein